MTDTIKTYLTKIQIGAEQSFKNLSIFPLLSDYFIPFDFLTIDVAVSKDLVEVLKIQQNESTPKHKVINKSDQMILIYDGEKLAKAGHLWNIGTTILIPAKKTVVIPASSIKNNRSPHNINRIRSREHAKSSRDYTEHFARVDSQVGTIFEINGKVAGMDCFGRSDVLKKTFMEMIESYARDAADNFNPKLMLGSLRPEAMDFLQMVKESRVQIEGPCRFETGCRPYSKMCTGYAVAHEDRVLRLSMVAKN